MVRLRCDVFACLPLLTPGACVFMYMCARSHTSVHSYGFVHACMHACVCTGTKHAHAKALRLWACVSEGTHEAVFSFVSRAACYESMPVTRCTTITFVHAHQDAAAAQRLGEPDV